MKYNVKEAARLSIAPMMDWTDRHCRYFHRLLSKNAMLYTEMVTAPAIVHGPKAKLLDYSQEEHPIALQIGGSDPDDLARATRIAQDWRYDEINLNCGCPSDRVQSGCFGAVLMKDPELVAKGVQAMQRESDVPVTVKCRIGVDDQEPQEILPRFIETVAATGANHFIIHARKAWLQGLSPKENREIPPLDYEIALEMKRRYPELTICLNGGVADIAQAKSLLEQGFDGVMIGRAAYHDPAKAVLGADQLWGDAYCPDPVQVVHQMLPYIDAHIRAGGKLHQIARHMLGLFHGRPGARGWRQVLSTEGTKPQADVETMLLALSKVTQAAPTVSVDA